MDAAANYVRGVSDAGFDQALAEISANSDWTLQCVVDGVGNSGTNPGFFRSGGAGTGTTFFINDGGNRRPWVRVNSSDILRPGSGAQWTAASKLNVLVRFANASRVECWFEGRLQHSATHSTSQEAMTAAASNAIFAFASQGYGGGGAETVTGCWLAIRMWSRYLDDQEMLTLARNELSLYEPKRTPVVAATAGASAKVSAYYHQMIGSHHRA